jgi:serine/threonine-protein kinase
MAHDEGLRPATVRPGGQTGGQTGRSEDERARWARVKAVFFRALDRPESERREFVEDFCAGDASLRDEVASLLASERAAGSFCETPAASLLGLDDHDGPAPTPRLTPGTRLGAYEITAFLSAGGMGEVYRARHTVLGREVAIKTVHAGPAGPDARRRLIREARNASGLDHPNICPIYEVGDEDGTPFIVMPLLQGRPLREIVRAGSLPPERVVDFGIQVAAALEHAHGQGIVHRDLKNSNVLVDPGGRAVVLDFGLARRIPRPSDGGAANPSVTVAGAVAGTMSHMAPEVLKGRGPDPRSDVWSLGVLLYELAAGRLPFQGRTPFETSSAILNEPPASLGRVVPLALRLVIGRCLVKDPDARYPTATAVREALEATRRRRGWPLAGGLMMSAGRRTVVAGAAALLVLAAAWTAAPHLRDRLGGPAGGVSSLAFLPFENATDDSDLEYYAAGFGDAVAAQFGAATRLRVIPPASAAPMAGGEEPAAVARALGADVIVTGRLRRASEHLAVDVRMVRADGGRVLWSDSFERAPAHVLALQADVVRALAAEARLTLIPGSRERLATARAVNPEAYEEFLKGRFEWNRRTAESLERAVRHFTLSIELDPTYAPAHAALADCYNQLGTVMVGAGSPREYRPLAVAAAIRALQLDPSSAEAHATLAYARHYDREWEAAEEGFRRAIALDPNYALARIWYANLLMSLGRFDEALEQAYAARELDPFSLVVNTNIAWVLNAAGRHEDAIAQLRLTLAIDSTYPQAHMRMVDALGATGRHEEAVGQAERLVALTGDWPPALLSLANALALAGRADEARRILDELFERHSDGYLPSWWVSRAYIALGDIDQALHWYERALEEGSNAIVYVPIDPEAGPLQRDPRFQELVARAGLR